MFAAVSRMVRKRAGAPENSEGRNMAVQQVLRRASTSRREMSPSVCCSQYAQRGRCAVFQELYAWHSEMLKMSAEDNREMQLLGAYAARSRHIREQRTGRGSGVMSRKCSSQRVCGRRRTAPLFAYTAVNRQYIRQVGLPPARVSPHTKVVCLQAQAAKRRNRKRRFATNVTKRLPSANIVRQRSNARSARQLRRCREADA